MRALGATVAAMDHAELIARVEARAGSVAAAHKLLGVSRSAWFRHKAAGKLPDEVAASIRAHLCLNIAAFASLQAVEL